MLDNLPSSRGADLTIAVNPRFRESLVKATDLYYEARADALNNLYKNLRSITGSYDQKQEWAADVEEVAGCCGYFSYCLHAFSQEMAVFLDILEQMEHYQNHKTRSWDWLKVWRRSGVAGGKFAGRDSEGIIPFYNITGIFVRLSDDIISTDAIPQAKLPDMLKPLYTKALPNMVQDQPVPFSYRIWKALKVFRRDDVKFGIKVGGGAAIYVGILALEFRVNMLTDGDRLCRLFLNQPDLYSRMPRHRHHWPCFLMDTDSILVIVTGEENGDWCPT